MGNRNKNKYLALKGLAPTVDPEVSAKQTGLVERFTTLFTLIRLLPC